MSLSLLLVRFPDGTIKYGSYQNTSDVPYCGLADSIEQWDRGDDLSRTVPNDLVVTVDIWCNYGGGFYWRGQACGNWLVDTGWREEEMFVTNYTDGTPDWVPAEYR